MIFSAKLSRTNIPMTAILRLSFILLLLQFISTVPHARGQCKRQSTNFDESPSFICNISVAVQRLVQCSTRVTETIWFPHTSGTPWFRNIAHYDGQYIPVESVSLASSFNDTPTQFSFNETSLRLEVPTRKTNKPIDYTLSYEMKDGVANYTGGCGFEVAKDNKEISYNHFRWTLGTWKRQMVDYLNVKFSTDDPNAVLHFGNKFQSSATGSEIALNLTFVDKSVTIHVLEEGNGICPTEFQCEEEWTLWHWLVGIGGAIFVVGGYIFRKVKKSKGTIKLSKPKTWIGLLGMGACLACLCGGTAAQYDFPGGSDGGDFDEGADDGGDDGGGGDG